LLTGICGVVGGERGVGVGRQRLPRRLGLEAAHRRSGYLAAERSKCEWRWGKQGSEAVGASVVSEVGGSAPREARRQQGGHRDPLVHTEHRAATHTHFLKQKKHNITQTSFDFYKIYFVYLV
jgi:hypothetical protein